MHRTIGYSCGTRVSRTRLRLTDPYNQTQDAWWKNRGGQVEKFPERNGEHYGSSGGVSGPILARIKIS